MELFAGILTSLLTLGGSAGIIVDKVATDLLRQQLVRAEQLEVRVDNAPNHQILQGKIDRVRVAGRGIFITPYLRIDTIDLETDPIHIDPSALQAGNLKLRKPLQAAVKVILKSEDLNAALRSPEISQSFINLKAVLPATNSAETQEFDLVDPKLNFLDNNHIRLTASLRLRSSEPQSSLAADELAIAVETKFNLVGGTRLELIEPSINVQGIAVPKKITDAFVQGLNKLLDLKQLEVAGITARVLKFEVTNGQMQVIGFAQMQEN